MAKIKSLQLLITGPLRNSRHSFGEDQPALFNWQEWENMGTQGISVGLCKIYEEKFRRE